MLFVKCVFLELIGALERNSAFLGNASVLFTQNNPGMRFFGAWTVDLAALGTFTGTLFLFTSVNVTATTKTTLRPDPATIRGARCTNGCAAVLPLRG